MTRAFVARLILVAVATLSLYGCVAGAKLRESTKLIRNKIDSVREAGAYNCAPAALARAEAHLEFLEYELNAGDFRRAGWHERSALENVNRAIETTYPEMCTNKRVVIADRRPVVITKTDRDGDGVTDDLDQCPDVAEDRDGFQDEDGCADLDNDADTVPDTHDKCILEPGDPKNNGCPVIDRDGDTIPDETDACPDIPEDFDGDQDQDGCPEESSKDTDSDGILDSDDKCPEAAEDRDSYQDEDGCPDPDNDFDTVLDKEDACPLQPGPATNNGCPVVDRDNDGLPNDLDQCPDVPGAAPSGCPKKVLVVKTDTRIEIKQQINFETSKNTIKGALSFEIIDQVAFVLKANPEIKLIIEGHTDSVGDAAKNLKLSDGRAAAVRVALIQRGVEGGRLESIGYGESKPIASNKTSKGKAANRRVEFNIVQHKVETTPGPAKP